MLHNLRGLVAVRLGRTSEAEASFRRVIKLWPQRSTGYTNLATLLSQTGHRDDAVLLFQSALGRDPKDFAALLGLGVTLATLGKTSESRAYLERARRARPRDFQA